MTVLSILFKTKNNLHFIWNCQFNCFTLYRTINQKTMIIKIPFAPYDRVMLNFRREQFNVDTIEGIVNSEGVILKSLRYDNNYLEHIKNVPTELKEVEVKGNRFNIGDEVIYHDTNNYRNFILQRGKVEKIKFVRGNGFTLFYYYVNGKFCEVYNVYSSKDDFIRRTKPTTELNEGERYIFTRYAIQQNKLVPIKIEKLTKIHSISKSGYCYGEKLRNSFLYTSKDKFINRLTAQI